MQALFEQKHLEHIKNTNKRLDWIEKEWKDTLIEIHWSNKQEMHQKSFERLKQIKEQKEEENKELEVSINEY